MDQATIDQLLSDAVGGPASASTPAGEVHARPAGDLIALLNYAAGIEAGKKPRRGMMITRAIPPGAVGRAGGKDISGSSSTLNRDA
jgi:hypothetical protein